MHLNLRGLTLLIIIYTSTNLALHFSILSWGKCLLWGYVIWGQFQERMLSSPQATMTQVNWSPLGDDEEHTGEIRSWYGRPEIAPPQISHKETLGTYDWVRWEDQGQLLETLTRNCKSGLRSSHQPCWAFLVLHLRLKSSHACFRCHACLMTSQLWGSPSPSPPSPSLFPLNDLQYYLMLAHPRLPRGLELKGYFSSHSLLWLRAVLWDIIWWTVQPVAQAEKEPSGRTSSTCRTPAGPRGTWVGLH